MRITTLTAIAPLLLVTAAFLSAPALATDANQATAMCDARGDACHKHFGPEGDVVILVNNGANGTSSIWCDKDGPCHVVGAKGVGTGKGATVGTVLRPTLGAVLLKQGTDSSPKRTALPVHVKPQPVEASGAGGSKPTGGTIFVEHSHHGR
jgi:hypothetical protein